MRKDKKRKDLSQDRLKKNLGYLRYANPYTQDASPLRANKNLVAKLPKPTASGWRQMLLGWVPPLQKSVSITIIYHIRIKWIGYYTYLLNLKIS